MARNISPLAGKPVQDSMLLNVPKLIEAYYENVPDAHINSQRVSFGTSGHRGSSFETTFNEAHIVAISQSICEYRKKANITGPLFLGFDTHALSAPAFATAMEVLAANGIDVMIAKNNEYTPTPVISYAILSFNKTHRTSEADGIVVTPSHNPPDNGGFKYNPPSGGPASLRITTWIEKKANELLESRLKGVKRIPYERALKAAATHHYDFIAPYINDLGSVVDMDAIRYSNIHMGVDPLGGAGVHYWDQITSRFGLRMDVINRLVDPTFRFIPFDFDGKVRMDPASPYAMANVVKIKDRFDVTFACDTDHDRHGIVTRSAGLLSPNHYLSVVSSYLLTHRPRWEKQKRIGKTFVTTQMIDRIVRRFERVVYEVPVGFKWFVDGLLDGTLGFCGEESAGASFSRLDGNVWTTDKDGIVLALLAAEITARNGDIGELYHKLEEEFGSTFCEVDEFNASLAQQQTLKNLSADQIKITHLGGDKIEEILTKAAGNGAAMGGIKIVTRSGWCAVRPSGTEAIYKIYAESFRNENHLQLILTEAHDVVDDL